jgi:hypothetical protein
VGDHDLRLRIDRLHAQHEAPVVAGGISAVHGTDKANSVLFGGHACDEAGEVACLLALGHVGEDVFGSDLGAGAEGEGDVRVLLGHFEHQVLVLGAVADDDVVSLGYVLEYGGSGVHGLHFFAVAVLYPSGKLFLRLENAVVHGLAPSLVIDGAFDDEGNLHCTAGGFSGV